MVVQTKLFQYQYLELLHVQEFFYVIYDRGLHWGGVIRNFTDFGRFGVHLFFILSGFLAANSLNKNNKLLHYYKKRIITILPLYYFVILYYFITENILNIYFHHIPSDTIGLRWLRYLFILNRFIKSNTYF